MGKYKVLITDYKFSSLNHEKKIMENIDAEVLTAKSKTEEDIIRVAHEDTDALLVQYAPVGKKVFNYLKQLKVIGCYGIGVDSVDVDLATEHEVTVINVPDYCIEEVANHTISLLMCCARKVSFYDKYIKNTKIWDFNVMRPIYGMKNRVLGLIGFGNIAKNMVAKLHGFGLDIIVYDPFMQDNTAEKYNIKNVALKKVLVESDFISINAPLNENTKKMLSNEEFKMMKDNCYLINTSRGLIIDEEALIQALKNNEIAGAALDVVEKEPINRDNPLLNLDNVILTPHVAFYSEDSLEKLQRDTAQGVAAVLTGKRPKSVVNKLFV